ncbi:hypothetical protein TRVA0_006S01816 [Trichomonascus vanleenenianus]|uniref:uncharacterized protein n=1 Tax=Trichomonascus vanleenenianus TaxID=2268995 RepID=UPI003EC97C39
MSRWRRKKNVDEAEEELCDAFEEVRLDTRSQKDGGSSNTSSSVVTVQDKDDVSALVTIQRSSTQGQERCPLPSIAEELGGAISRCSLDDTGQYYNAMRKLRRESSSGAAAAANSGQKRMMNRPPSAPLPVALRTSPRRPRSAGCTFASASPLHRIRIRRAPGHCGFEASSNLVHHPANYGHLRRRRLFYTSPGCRRKRGMSRYDTSLLGPIFEEITLLNKISAELDLSCEYTTTSRNGSYSWSRDLAPDSIPRLIGRRLELPQPLLLEDPSTSRAATARVTSNDYSETSFYLQQLELTNHSSQQQQLQPPINETAPTTTPNENDELERTFKQLDLSDKKSRNRNP